MKMLIAVIEVVIALVLAYRLAVRVGLLEGSLAKAPNQRDLVEQVIRVYENHFVDLTDEERVRIAEEVAITCTEFLESRGYANSK